VQLLQSNGEVRRLAYGADGRRLSAWGPRTSARVQWWDLASAAPTDPTPLHGRPFLITSAATADAIAYMTETGLYVVGSSGEYIASVPGLTSERRPTAIAITDNARVLAISSGYDQGAGEFSRTSIYVGWVKQPRTQYRHFRTGLRISVLLFSSDGRYLASGGASWITVWDLKAGESVCAFQVGTQINSLLFSRDSSTLLVSAGEFIQLWDIAASRQKQTLVGHQDLVTCLAVSPDGNTLVSGSLDRTVKIWDLANGKMKRSYSWPTGPVHALAVAPDGLTAAAGGESGDIVIWDVEE
jgi:WD40 repeat protein